MLPKAPAINQAIAALPEDFASQFEVADPKQLRHVIYILLHSIGNMLIAFLRTDTRELDDLTLENLRDDVSLLAVSYVSTVMSMSRTRDGDGLVGDKDC